MANFTDTFIKRLKPGVKREEKFEGAGFGILIYPTGSKSWIYRYKINNKKDYIIFGHYPEMTLSDARKQFLALRDIKRSGANPKEVISNRNSQMHNTVKNLVLEWYTGYIEKQRAQPKQIKQIIDADILPLLGDKRIEDLSTKNITQALDKIVNRGAPVHANKVLATIKQALGYGVRRGSLVHNPAASILAKDIGGAEKPRERYLSINEIKTLWLFLDSDSHALSLQTKNALKIILLTGARTGELRLATWNEFDFNLSLWTIPSEHTKSRITMRIHLSPLVRQLLLELKKQTNSVYVLSGISGKLPLSEKVLAKAVLRLHDRLSMPHWTPHDLRRTFATQLGETLDIDPVVIEKCLGHKMPKIMATYNKNEMLPQRKSALNQWSDYIEKLISEKQDGVTQLLYLVTA